MEDEGFPETHGFLFPCLACPNEKLSPLKPIVSAFLASLGSYWGTSRWLALSSRTFHMCTSGKKKPAVSWELKKNSLWVPHRLVRGRSPEASGPTALRFLSLHGCFAMYRLVRECGAWFQTFPTRWTLGPPVCRALSIPKQDFPGPPRLLLPALILPSVAVPEVTFERPHTRAHTLGRLLH